MKLRKFHIAVAFQCLLVLPVSAEKAQIRETSPGVFQKPGLYGGVEYLRWWVKGAPLGVPLVSTGPRENEDGFLLDSRSSILYGAPFAPATGGNDTQSFPGFSGGRFTLGYQFDVPSRLAIEGRVFFLQTQWAGYTAEGSSTMLGGAGARIPLFNTVPYNGGSDHDSTASENGLPVFLSGILAGKVVIANRLNFWGADASASFHLGRASRWDFTGIAGFRYLNLSEDFDLTDTLVGLSGPFVGQSGSVRDHFGTSNQFFGPTLGLRAGTAWGRLSLNVCGRLALGVSCGELNVGGAFQAVNYTSTTGSQGIFAQPSNSGTRTSTVFAVVPEVEIKLGYDLTPNVRITVGYEFIYYSSVVRPGLQLDRNLPKGQVFQQGGSAVNLNSPSPAFNKSDFFAHGLSVGVNMRF